MKTALSVLLPKPKKKIVDGAERFCRSLSTIGPHPIPKSRQIANEFHRIFSIKAGMRLVECESPLEADAVIWGEARPQVTSICEQPLRIHGAIGNKPHHTLDLKFGFDDNTTTYYEVKPESHLKIQDDGEPTPANWPVIRSWFLANGKDCDVITDETMRRDTQLIENWRTLLPFAIRSYEAPDPSLEKAVIALLMSNSVSTFASVHERMPDIPSEELTGHLAKLLHQGRLTANLRRSPVSPMTELRPVGDDNA